MMNNFIKAKVYKVQYSTVQKRIANCNLEFYSFKLLLSKHDSQVLLHEIFTHLLMQRPFEAILLIEWNPEEI